MMATLISWTNVEFCSSWKMYLLSTVHLSCSQNKLQQTWTLQGGQEEKEWNFFWAPRQQSFKKIFYPSCLCFAHLTFISPVPTFCSHHHLHQWSCHLFSFLSCPPNPSSSVQLLLEFTPLINWASVQVFRHSSYYCAVEPSKHDSTAMFEAL